MIRFAQTTPPRQAKTNYARYVALVYAGMLVGMAVAQLFEYEDFVPLLQSFGLAGGESAAMVCAGVIVIAEVFALPFLLRMYVSPLMRVLSMVLGWLVAAIWTYILVVLTFSVNAVTDTGMLGTAVTVPSGWWNLGYAVVLIVLAGWSSWGLWPGTLRTKPSKK